MRLIHTSDWHLGRSFHQVGLLGAQAQFVDHLVETVRSERVDAVLVAGDVYDRALPAPETVALLSEAVTRLIDAGAQVVLSSGNHDSGIRLGFASELLSRAGLHIRCSVSAVGQPVLVGGVAIYPLPYLEPSIAADPLAASERTHAGVLRAAMARVRSDLASHQGQSVVMAHAFVTGGATSESERDISVGGVSAVHPRVFSGIGYVALGHLHGRQQITDRVRYSGSPIAMSFSEARQVKGSWLVEMGGAGVARCMPVEAPVHRGLTQLRGDLEGLLRDPALAGAEGAYCQITLTDAVRPVAAMERLRRRFPHALVLQFEPQGAPAPMTTYAAKVGHASEFDMCCDFLAHVRGGQCASAADRSLLREAVEGARLARGALDGEGTAAPASGAAGGEAQAEAAEVA